MAKSNPTDPNAGAPQDQGQPAQTHAHQPHAGQQHNQAEPQGAQALMGRGFTQEGADVLAEAQRAGFGFVDVLLMLIENSPQLVNLIREILSRRQAQQSAKPA